MATGGDIIEITYNHPTLGSGVLYPQAGQDGTFDLGGFMSNDDAAMIDGSGQAIRQITRTRWKVSTTCSWDMNSIDEVSVMKALAEDPTSADWTFELINGTVWGGKGFPVGEVVGNTKGATFALVLAGSDKITKIAG